LIGTHANIIARPQSNWNGTAFSLYPPEKAAVLKRGDYALLSAMWWPRAEATRLQTVTFWFLWLFTWDDEIDQSTSALFINLDDANKFREESFHYVRYCLGVPNEDTHKFQFDDNPPKNKIIHSLDVIGAELREVYNKGGFSITIPQSGIRTQR
jgi:hypothetical protein